MAAPKEYNINYLVIHGNLSRAKQFRYTDKTGSEAYSDLKAGVPESLVRQIADAYNDPSMIRGGHYGGNPAFCMKLRISDFFATHDKTIGFTVKEAYVRAFPKNYSNDELWAFQQNISLDPQHAPAICSRYAPVDTGHGGTEAPINYNQYYAYYGFGLPFSISAVLISGTRILQEVTLLSKPDYNPVWNDNVYRMDHETRISGEYEDSSEKVILGIVMHSDCSCKQGDRPVFAADITEYIPKVDPYVWRRFGTNQTNDPIGYSLDPSLCDGDWHLVRPFYYMKNSSSSKNWKNVEDQ